MVTTQQLDQLYLKMPGTEAVTLTTKRGVKNETTTGYRFSRLDARHHPG